MVPLREREGCKTAADAYATGSWAEIFEWFQDGGASEADYTALCGLILNDKGVESGEASARIGQLDAERKHQLGLLEQNRIFELDYNEALAKARLAELARMDERKTRLQTLTVSATEDVRLFLDWFSNAIRGQSGAQPDRLMADREAALKLVELNPGVLDAFLLHGGNLEDLPIHLRPSGKTENLVPPRMGSMWVVLPGGPADPDGDGGGEDPDLSRKVHVDGPGRDPADDPIIQGG